MTVDGFLQFVTARSPLSFLMAGYGVHLAFIDEVQQLPATRVGAAAFKTKEIECFFDKGQKMDSSANVENRSMHTGGHKDSFGTLLAAILLLVFINCPQALRANNQSVSSKLLGQSGPDSPGSDSWSFSLSDPRLNGRFLTHASAKTKATSTTLCQLDLFSRSRIDLILLFARVHYKTKLAHVVNN